MSLYDLADAVHDEESFLEFLNALCGDREDEVRKEAENPSSPYGPGANGWENGSIQAFLGAACAWADTSKNGMPLYTPPKNPWRRFADIIHSGKFYE